LSDPYSASFDDLDSIRRITEAHGFCLVKNMFSPEQMDRLEHGLAADHATFNEQLPELLSCPSIRWAALEPRVLAAAHALMDGPLYYYGESHLDFEKEIGPRSLSPFSTPHFDARGSRESLNPFWSSPTDEIFRGYRFAIYFRDYKRYSGGLMVGVGSHRGDLKSHGVGAPLKLQYIQLKFGEQTFTVGYPEYPLYIVPSEPGDLVIWNLRTMHSAGARRLAAKPNLAMWPRYQDKIFKIIPNVFLPLPGPRNAFFFDYGTATEEVDLYIKHRSLRVAPGRMEHWSYDDEEVQAAFKSENIKFRFDPIIAYLCVRIDQLRKQSASGQELNGLAHRLRGLLEKHEEFSPYFSLFSAETYAEHAAQSQTDAVNYVVDAVLKCIASPK
jgi:hypothetical protein